MIHLFFRKKRESVNSMETVFENIDSHLLHHTNICKMNYDLQATRTMEIPACGSLLMAERTAEHDMLFKDKKEAVFFSSDEELLQLCQYYINHEEEREKIAKAGRCRCLTSGYSNYETLKKVIESIYENTIYLQK